jgi:LuxR family transcriptional regulator, quorum-sensing system regulator BjaR1
MRSTRARSEFSRETFTFIDGLERLSTLDRVAMALEEALAQFGVENFIVTGLPTKDQSFDDLVIASRWPPEFFMLYADSDYVRSDPLAQQSIQSHMPFEWAAESYGSHADPRIAEMMTRSADFGLKQGYLVPIHGPHGYEGCVSMAGAELDLSSRGKAALHLMALYAFDRMRRLRGHLPDRKSPLTAREREVLAWAAKGKSASQISQALKISKRTVDEHTQTAARKLGAANRTQAVAIALRDRIIEA